MGLIESDFCSIYLLSFLLATIITKDSDFSDRILLNTPPPKVIHIKFGNLKIKPFYNLIHQLWNDVIELSETHKLVKVFDNRIEGIN